jgi:hypothetical protein
VSGEPHTLFVTVAASASVDAALTVDTPAVRSLNESIEAAIAGHGELYVDVVAKREVTVEVWGPDGDRLLAALTPVLKASPFVDRAWVLVRYGGIGAPERQVSV